jgi:hypothetical protein
LSLPPSPWPQSTSCAAWRLRPICGTVSPAIRALARALAWVALLPCLVSASDVDELWKKSADALKDRIEGAHPATYYVFASKLFQDGRKDEAVFWFYLGQLRYRIHLGARKGHDPSGDAALFGSLSEAIDTRHGAPDQIPHGRSGIRQQGKHDGKDDHPGKLRDDDNRRCVGLASRQPAQEVGGAVHGGGTKREE